jgi:hypothetical protein
MILGLVLMAGCTGNNEDQAGAGIESGQEEDSFAAVDTDANGLISEEEAGAVEALADNFDQADANDSGYLSRDEYQEVMGSRTLQE